MSENKVENFCGEEMASVFWDSERILLAEFLKSCATVNSERFVQTLERLMQRIRKFRPNGKINHALILPIAPI